MTTGTKQSNPYVPLCFAGIQKNDLLSWSQHKGVVIFLNKLYDNENGLAEKAITKIQVLAKKNWPHRFIGPWDDRGPFSSSHNLFRKRPFCWSHDRGSFLASQGECPGSLCHSLCVPSALDAWTKTLTLAITFLRVLATKPKSMPILWNLLKFLCSLRQDKLYCNE